MRILASPAFGNRRTNPYNWLLYSHVAATGVEVYEYSWRRLLLGSYDVWHIHWPEAPLNHRNPVRALSGVVRLLVMMQVARLRGIKVLWTIHNLAAHEEQHPRAAPWFWRLFLRRLDGYINTTTAAQALALEKFPGLAQLPGFIIPLGHFRGVYPDGVSPAEARVRLDLERDATVLAFVGQVRRYKGVAELCAAFKRLDDEDARLVIAGDPRHGHLEVELRSEAACDPRIKLHLAFVPDDRLQVYLRSADLVVLPFVSVLNSASVLLALSFDRPVLVPYTPSFGAVREAVGPEWIRMYQGPLTSRILAEAITWTEATPRPTPPRLESREWPLVARLTAGAYAQLTGRRPAELETPVNAAKEDAPKVSVVIPVYNRATRVRAAIESVLAQTYQNFEIIVVDDCSTDGTAEAVAAIAEPRITVIRHDRNRGGSAARNTGIRASSGEYVAFLDSDDEWLPSKLERQLDVFARCGNRIGLVYTGTERTFADGSVSRQIPRRRADTKSLLSWNVVGETSVGMVRRTVLQEIGGFDETLPASQDLDLWLRISERSLLEFVPEALVRVAKGNDRGRITANVGGTIRGRDLFCRKYRQQMHKNGVLHRYLRYTGWVCQRGVQDLVLARRFYWDSLSVKPLAPLTYLLLLVTCLPTSWLDSLAVWRHRRGKPLAFQQGSAFMQSGYAASVYLCNEEAGIDSRFDQRVP